MKTPPYIKPGSKIRIVSPAGKIDKKYVLPAVEWFQKQGYKVEIGEHAFSQHFQFAGTDSQRLEDLQNAFDDAETDVVLCSRGGYGTVRIIDKLNFENFQKKPKWLVGFSDITILHSCLNKSGFATIHGAMPRYYFDENGEPAANLNSLMKILSGEKVAYSFKNWEHNKEGKVEAKLVGGNLSIISSLQGTKYELETDGKILFLEDIDEFLYHSDRMMHQLKLAGKLDKLAGLILGDFTDMKDNESPFGKNIHEIISEAVQEFEYPVAFGFQAGHDKKNLALAFEKTWQLDVSSVNSTLKLL
ncbi:LD-carboxypeptidase [Maribellus comscasis]|uniref:LD-carboxypeptidase n=1 Tax=Maribellus comscasis TaxID=2681766 RepID=A0A6I6JZH6_9BACT|nr:LD-carboxypeptidase [Maribellus comscasis]QGY44573.1 LD-carboxypeptidase [Maribellus comscasis]